MLSYSSKNWFASLLEFVPRISWQEANILVHYAVSWTMLLSILCVVKSMLFLLLWHQNVNSQLWLPLNWRSLRARILNIEGKCSKLRGVTVFSWLQYYSYLHVQLYTIDNLKLSEFQLSHITSLHVTCNLLVVVRTRKITTASTRRIELFLQTSNNGRK